MIWLGVLWWLLVAAMLLLLGYTLGLARGRREGFDRGKARGWELSEGGRQQAYRRRLGLEFADKWKPCPTWSRTGCHCTPLFICQR